jgi:hypothetical protein
MFVFPAIYPLICRLDKVRQVIYLLTLTLLRRTDGKAVITAAGYYRLHTAAEKGCGRGLLKVTSRNLPQGTKENHPVSVGEIRTESFQFQA